VRLDYVISPSIDLERIPFALARKKSPIPATCSSDKDVESQNLYSAVLSLDYVPELPNLIGRQAERGCGQVACSSETDISN